MRTFICWKYNCRSVGGAGCTMLVRDGGCIVGTEDAFPLPGGVAMAAAPSASMGFGAAGTADLVKRPIEFLLIFYCCR
jgi:hypothetical protein